MSEAHCEVTLCVWEENYEMCCSKQESESKVPLFLTPVPGRSSSVTGGKASEMQHLERWPHSLASWTMCCRQVAGW